MNKQPDPSKLDETKAFNVPMVESVEDDSDEMTEETIADLVAYLDGELAAEEVTEVLRGMMPIETVSGNCSTVGICWNHFPGLQSMTTSLEARLNWLRCPSVPRWSNGEDRVGGFRGCGGESRESSWLFLHWVDLAWPMKG